MARTIGIDLGTTNSVVSFIDGSRVEIVPNPEGSPLTPSVVYYKSGEDIIVGEVAKRQIVASPDRVVRSVKRIMGKRFEDVSEDEREELPYRVTELEDGMAGVLIDEDVRLRPEEVSADILDKLRAYAEDFIGDEVAEAVITVPAHFNDQQRTSTKAAAEMAGLDVQRIINEPTAAALAYGFGGDHSGCIAVFDFGGGTFDVSILEIHGDVFEVLATNGDNQLGGDDIDQRLIREVCDRIVTDTGIDATADRTAMQRIREAAEKAKCELSNLNSTTISLPFIVADERGPQHFELEISRAEFDAMMEPLFERLLTPCRRALEDASKTIDQLRDVVLVGGSTRIPRVQELVTEFFGREPNRSVNPDEAVSAGAAIQSAVITGSLREVLLLDVAPLTLGIELAGGVFKSLIDRNSTVPCEARRRFTTVVDNQTTVLVHVLQGERKKASENHTLARFRLTGIPPAPKELAEIEVHFQIDANGILAVSALDLTTGLHTGVVVENYGEIGSRRGEIESLLESAESALDEDDAFVRFSARRAKAERMQARANAVIDAAADIIEEEHLKSLKENMLRLDLAMEAMDEGRMSLIEDELEAIVLDYEQNAGIQRALSAALGGELDPVARSNKSGTLRMPTDTHFDNEDLPANVRSHTDGSRVVRKPKPPAPPPARPPATPTSTPPAVEDSSVESYDEAADWMPPEPDGMAEPDPTPSGIAVPKRFRTESDTSADDFDPTAIPPPPPSS